MKRSTRRSFMAQVAAAGLVSACARPLRPGDRQKARRAPRVVRIKGLIRREESILRLGGVGDNWHMTWAADDRQYVSLCDGFGWPGMPGYDQEGSEFHSRLYAIRGHPPEVSFEYLPGYPRLVHGVDRKLHWTGNQPSYYNYGTLALDGHIYQYLSTINRPPSPDQEGGGHFIGSKLIYSPDNGRTWCNQDGSTPVIWEDWSARSRKNMIFFQEDQEAFSLLSVLQMGKNYEANIDGYVYVYAPNGMCEGSMNELVMYRVPKTRILDRRAYEFFSGLRSNGEPSWTQDILSRSVVHKFPSGWLGEGGDYAWQPSVTYNAPLGLYMMANWGWDWGAQGALSRPGYLGFWISKHPWGPWEQIHEEKAWMPGGDSNARAYQPQIAPKWIAPDGKSFWLVWSDIQARGRWTEATFSATTKQALLPYYAFNCQRVDIVTA